MRIRAVDFETTGETADAGVCEVGYCDLIRDDLDGVVVDQPVAYLCNPGRPIPPEASAIHHLIDADVARWRPFPETVAVLRNGTAEADGVAAYAAHKCDFEEQFFDGDGKPWLCTYKAALRHWPDAPAHKLQVLRYWLKIDDEPDFRQELASPPHRAAPDTYICAFVLRRLIAETSVKQVRAWTVDPYLLPKVHFGKHKGARWHDLPDSYIDWLVTKATDLGADVLDTARHHAQQRGII